MGFQIVRPDRPVSGVIFSSPHSGRSYPPDFLDATDLDEHAIRSSEDAFVDRLIADAPDLGAVLITADLPRAYVDLNRSADELDPALVEGLRRVAHNPRVTSGLGVIPRVVANGRAIYRGKLSLQEARARLDRVWHPYHDALAALLREQTARFGSALLVDCHSMPHEALDASLPGASPAPDVVLGDRFGVAADPVYVDAIEAAFRDEGLRVARNCPFAGAYITQHYGRPAQRQHVVQIELDRALYMDEEYLRPRPDFDEMRALMRRIMARIVALGQPRLPLAAE